MALIAAVNKNGDRILKITKLHFCFILDKTMYVNVITRRIKAIFESLVIGCPAWF